MSWTEISTWVYVVVCWVVLAASFVVGSGIPPWALGLVLLGWLVAISKIYDRSVSGRR